MGGLCVNLGFVTNSIYLNQSTKRNRSTIAPNARIQARENPVGNGSLPQKILINGGEQRGFWANGAYPPPGPDTIIVSILP